MADGLFSRFHARATGWLQRRRLAKLSRQEAFAAIYADGIWDTDGRATGDFYSGTGSHDAPVVDPYVKAVTKYLGLLGKPDVADLGCGDFAVGSQIRQACGKYLAGDIVPELIRRNQVKFASLDVDFRVIDIVTDEIPQVDVLTIRQVLQHLSNSDILLALEKIERSCRYLILTEHLPIADDFIANSIGKSGPDIRLYERDPSGVVLTRPPFNLRPRSETILCDIPDGFSGRLQTIAYELNRG